ncbi:hypothetical protein OAG76_01220 [Rubripirellula sp.]|nr:hypothetical protein [Rubripirellula sp.]MDB4634002.1 hypothetical protein [Rubripirellula sp.]
MTIQSQSDFGPKSHHRILASLALFYEVMDNGQAGTSPELMARAFFTCHQPDNRQGETP